MATIRITPQELREAATFITGKLSEINTDVGDIKSRIDAVADEWEGAAQSAFVSTFNDDMYPLMSSTLPQVIEGICGMLTSAADALETADSEVASALKGE
jgi:WXG100 family type VII secretion target